MQLMRVSCPDCLTVEVSAQDMTAHLCVDNGEGHYSFRCPKCGFRVSRPASQHIIDIIISEGVHLKVWKLPKELIEPHTVHPFSADEVIDLYQALATFTTFEEVTH